MRVLHLIDGTGGRTTRLDLTSGACAALRNEGDEQAVCVIGPAPARRRVAAMGAPVRWSIAPAAGARGTAARALRRVAAAWPPDVVHCWGAEMLSMSQLGFPAGTPTVGIIDRRPPLNEPVTGCLEAPLSDAILLCYDQKAGEALGDLHGTADVNVVTPPAPGRKAQSGAVRAKLGLAEQDLAVLLVGDAPEADSLRFAFMLGLLEVAGRVIVGVAPASARHRARGERLRRRALRRIPMITSDLHMLELASACDLAVWDAGGPGPTSHQEPDAGAGPAPIASLLARGLPVVAPRHEGIARLYPAEAAEACLAMNSSLTELARKLMTLGDDAGLRARVSAAAARHAAGADWTGVFVRSVREAWTRVVRSAGAGVRT
jgi:hypothetical protein